MSRVIDLGNQTQGIHVTQDNLDYCAEFAKSGETTAKSKFGAVDVITRSTCFKIHPGEWLLKRNNCVFKLTDSEYAHMYLPKVPKD